MDLNHIIILTGCVIQAYFIKSEYDKKYSQAVILKGLASLYFVILGFRTAAQCSDPAFASAIRTGLIFGMAGDILLNLRFVFEKQGQKIFLAGILAFLIGHILYLKALIPLAQDLMLCIGIGALIAAALLAYIFKTMDVRPAFKIFGVFYLGAVIIMSVIAVSLLFHSPTTGMKIFALGAVLFMLSDIVLIFNTFGSSTSFSRRILNLSMYYVGQILIALSLLTF
ncbi:MAG: lysoplasmalogenase [Solobacterium sp.]|nr:lysoplasmalogenase [Solobacterium sp.]